MLSRMAARQVGALRSTPAKPVLLRHAAARAESQTANITPGGATGAPQRLRQTSSNPGASGPPAGWYSEQQSQLGGGATSQQFQQMGQGVSRDPLQQAYQAADTQHENFEVRDYDARYKNSIVLVGTLASEPQMRYFDGGGGVLKMNLAFKNSRNRDGWIQVDAWPPLAERCQAHLRTGMKVQIQGEMQFGSWVDKETGKKRSSIDMCAQHIWHIQGGEDEVPSGTKSEVRQKLWDELNTNPNAFWDNRERKQEPGTNPRMPDFKHKLNGEGLWLDSMDRPSWISITGNRLDQ